MATNNRVLLVVNPISGGRDKTSIINQIKETLTKNGFEYDIFKTTGDRDKENLKDIIDEYAPSRIFVIGGDGTIKLLAEILKNNRIPIGIFPAGSANGLAENLNLPTGIPELVHIGLGENYVELDTISVNDELCLHISDVGLNAALIKNYHEGTIRGKLGYILHSIPTLIESEFPFQFKIEREGKILHRKAVLLAIANARKYGTGSTINPQGKYNDGLFEILIFKEFNIPEILKTFREKVTLSQDFVEIFSASEVHIECTKNIPFQVDGEYRGEVGKVHAYISPIKIKITVPEKKV
jgi:diacylglycerol kinase (ATP)